MLSTKNAPEELIHCLEAYQKPEHILENGFRPRGNSAFVIQLDEIDWEAGEKNNDKNGQYQLHAWRMLDSFIISYTNNRICSVIFWDAVLGVLKSWHDLQIANGACSHLWFDMATGIRCSKLAFLIHASRHDLEADKKNRRISPLLDRLARLHLERFVVDKNLQGNNNSNHDYFLLKGKQQLLRAYASKLNLEAEAQENRIESLFKSWFPNGCHCENSPAYHFFMLEKLKLHVSTNQASDLSSLLNLADKIKDFFCFPERLIQFGDTDGGKIGKKIHFPKKIDATYSDIVEFTGDYAWLCPQKAGDGYFVVRSTCHDTDNFSMFAVNGKNRIKTHKHDDYLSYELYEKGQFIYTDSGKYSYSLDNFSESFRLPSAHNSIMLSTDTVHCLYEVRGHPLLDRVNVEDGGMFRIKGSYNKNKFSVSRHFSYIPGTSLEVADEIQVYDSLGSELWYFLQFSPHLKIQKESDRTFMLQSETDQNIATIQLSIQSNTNSSPEAEIEIAKGFHDPSDNVTVGFYSSSYNRAIERSSLWLKVRLKEPLCSLSITQHTTFLP